MLMSTKRYKKKIHQRNLWSLIIFCCMGDQIKKRICHTVSYSLKAMLCTVIQKIQCCFLPAKLLAKFIINNFIMSFRQCYNIHSSGKQKVKTKGDKKNHRIHCTAISHIKLGWGVNQL